jgi:endonuclease III
MVFHHKTFPIGFEIGPKTGSLIFHAAFGKMMTLQVDLHVWHAFRKWGWTNAKSTDECSWQASQWMDPSYFISTNEMPLDLSVRHWPMAAIAK